MKRLIAGSLVLVAWFTVRSAFGETPAPRDTAPTLVAASAESISTRGFDLEWSQGEPFVGAADGSTTTMHGYHHLAGNQSPTAMVPASSGLSLIVMRPMASGYRLSFDEARTRYLVKLFGGQGRLLRIYVIYPGQEDLNIPYSKLPSGPIHISVHNREGNPLQTFKVPVGADS